MTDARSQGPESGVPAANESGTAPAQSDVDRPDVDRPDVDRRGADRRGTGVSGTSAMPGGRRRIDRVLADDFADHLEDLPMEELRSRRKDAEQEETDLSYLRRLIQGRIDIVQAEIERRGGAEKKNLVEQLTGILAEGSSRQPHGSGRFMTVEPSRLDERRRRVEKVLADVDISNANARSDDELRASMDRLHEMEAEVSRDRRLVQHVMDICTAEIGRRYREGTAHVEDLLQPR